MNRRRTIQTLLFACFAGAALLQPALAQPAVQPAPAIRGYDPVAYFTESKAVKGVPSIARDFDGDRYHFSSAKNRDLFAADPDRYAPQFGGLCAAGISEGRTVEADPTAFVVRDGKLYLFSAAKGIAKLEKDPSLLVKARAKYQPK